jgi:hypothetical protein
MSAITDIQEAAKYLDDYCEYKDWRSKINIDDLSMLSSNNCVLGQLYGGYGAGKNILIMTSDEAMWEAVEDTFCDHTSEWKQYLRNYVAPAVSTDLIEGSEWVSKNDSNYSVTLHHTFVREGFNYVVRWRQNSGTFAVSTESEFRRLYQPKSVYIDGQLYWSKDGKLVILYQKDMGNGKPGFIRLNTLGNMSANSGFGTVHYYEDRFGPLTEIQASNYDGNKRTVNASLS